MRNVSLAFATVVLCSALAAPANAGDASVELRERLAAIEVESHQLWLRADLPALDDLMAAEFHFVVMNGALESKVDVVGSKLAAEEIVARRPLQVESLRVEPEHVLVRGQTAIVISLLDIDATVRDRPIPRRMRILSVYSQTPEDQEWRLTARSITPILAPPSGKQAVPAPPDTSPAPTDASGGRVPPAQVAGE